MDSETEGPALLWKICPNIKQISFVFKVLKFYAKYSREFFCVLCSRKFWTVARFYQNCFLFSQSFFATKSWIRPLVMSSNIMHSTIVHEAKQYNGLIMLYLMLLAVFILFIKCYQILCGVMDRSDTLIMLQSS